MSAFVAAAPYVFLLVMLLGMLLGMLCTAMMATFKTSSAAECDRRHGADNSDDDAVDRRDSRNDEEASRPDFAFDKCE